MNRKQKVVVVLGAVVIMGLALFPPWFCHLGSYTPHDESVEASQRESRGWRGFRFFALGYRTDDWLRDGAYPDSDAAISLQLGVAALTLAAVLVLKDRKPSA